MGFSYVLLVTNLEVIIGIDLFVVNPTPKFNLLILTIQFQSYELVRKYVSILSKLKNISKIIIEAVF